MTARLRRSGFTLTELLVVTTLMISLMGLVVANARPSQASRGDIRRGAQQLASVLLASQSISLGSPTGAAVIIDSAGTYGEVLSHARRYPFIEGTVVMPVVSPTATQVSLSLTPQNDSSEALTHGFMVRFRDRMDGALGPPTAWFTLSCTAPPQATVRHRIENGQTSLNTLWPSSGTLAFQAARYPIPTGITQTLPKGVAIDLRYSGYADQAVTSWSSLNGRGAVGVGFDTVGSVDTLMQNVLPAGASLRTVQPICPAEEIYFFVTLRSDIDDAMKFVLASEQALWVVVHPKTGRITISPNVPQFIDDATALRKARSKAREGITIGG